jgi:hypothetical protein
VTNEEHRTIHENAQRTGLSASRFLVRRGLGLRLPPIKETLPPSPQDRRQIEIILTDLRRVGVNLNQLARRANRSRLFGTMGPPKSRVREAAAEAEILLKLLKNRL